jgi:hypothetical protein
MMPPARLLSLILGCLLLAGAPALRARDRPVIDVRREGDTFHVQARLFARVPPALAWEVLTDFEHMDRFVPNLEESRIESRDGNRLTIVQRGVARFGPLAMGFQSERNVTLLPPGEIRSVQVSGSMRRMASVTRFSGVEGGTELVYSVEAEPGTLFPAAITQRFLVHEIAEQFMAIADEMERRARR